MCHSNNATRAEDSQVDFTWLTSRLPTGRPLRLFDIGCGSCPEGDALSLAGVEVTGIDLDEEAIQSARARLPGGTFLCGDAGDLAGKHDHSFEVILLRRPDLTAQPARWRKVLSMVCDWLASDGQVLLSTPGPEEARLGLCWLDEAGFLKTNQETLDHPGERFLLTAREPIAGQAKSRPALPGNVIRWEDDEAIAACDPRTGMCGTVPSDDGPSLETDHVQTS